MRVQKELKADPQTSQSLPEVQRCGKEEVRKEGFKGVSWGCKGENIKNIHGDATQERSKRPKAREDRSARWRGPYTGSRKVMTQWFSGMLYPVAKS